MALFQLKVVAKLWYSQWKGNRLVVFGPIRWEEFKEAFLGKYFPCERREMSVEGLINLNQGNTRVEGILSSSLCCQNMVHPLCLTLGMR